MTGKNLFDPKKLKVEKATTRKRSFYEKLKADSQKSEAAKAKCKRRDDKRRADPQKYIDI
jgi:hypothetical protein